MNTFTERILSMQAELEKYKRDKDDLLCSYVSDRLTKSLVSYQDDLETSLKYLENRKQLNLMKKMNRHI